MKTKANGKNSTVSCLVVLVLALAYVFLFAHTTGAFEAFGLVKTEEKEVVWATKAGPVQGQWIAVDFPKNLR